MNDKKVIKIIAIVSAALIVGLLSYVLIFAGKSGKEEKVERYSVPSREYIFINGVYEPRSMRVFETNSTKGEAGTVGVKDGDEVTSGQTIITYRNDEAISQISEMGYDIEALRTAKANDYEMRKKAQNQKIATRNQMIAQAKKMGEPIDYSQLPSTEMDPPSTDFDAQIAKIQRQIGNAQPKQYTNEISDISGIASVESVMGQTGSKETRVTIRSKEYLITGNVKEKDINKIANGMEGEALIIATDKKVKSKIAKVGETPIASVPSLQTQAGAPGMNMGASASNDSVSEYKVEATLEEEVSDIVDGFHVQIKLPVGDYKMTVPNTAIFDEGDKRYVFVIGKDNIIKKRKILIKKRNKKDSVIKEGLKENEEIVSSPNPDMKEGDIVE